MPKEHPGWVAKTSSLNPETYDQLRPRYPGDLFSAIRHYTAISENSSCLEIGVGTGQATEPFLTAGCRITALEPSPSLAAFTQRKYQCTPALEVLPESFENFQPQGGFDLIYAATSFHWIRAENRMTLLQSHLKPNGAVALFWNHPRPLDPIHADMQPVYRKLLPTDPAQNTPPWSLLDASKIAIEMTDAGFRDVETHFFRQERHLTTQQYVGLLHTYSNHLDQPDAVRTQLMEELGAIIDAHGGTITITDTIDLHLGRF